MKVFDMLSIGRCSQALSAADDSKVTTIAYGERVYHAIYKFVVVKISKGNRPLLYCRLVPTSKIQFKTLNNLRSRIHNYKGKSATSGPRHPADHAIVYSGRVPPDKYPEEQTMTMDPLRVNIENGGLPPTSRIDLALLYPINKNTKVNYVGDMDAVSRRKLFQYQKEVSKRYEAAWVDNAAWVDKSEYHLQLDNQKD